MIRGPGINIRKIILSLLFLSGVTVSIHSQGTSIGGVINEYTDVVAIGIENATISNSAIFSPGDTVLLIQMKGAVMLGSESNAYGTYQYSLGTPGAYEFLVILSVGGNNVVFTRDLVNTYDVSGNVQLIKVPSYNSAVVTSELTCLPWDSVTTKTGGVIAIIVGGTLTLDADINVNGKGLIGGIPFTGDGICLNTDPALYNKYAYPYSYTNSGYKGESVVSRAYLGSSNIPSIYPDFAKGKGANFTGGGGGNGRFSGGGGGAGIGFGGIGGRENSSCGIPGDGGQGGKQVINTALEGNILLGGGGGSSTSATGSTATPGGKGGGIVIIICDTLKSNGINTIMANGESATLSVGNAGAGGGGGGGSLALYQKSFSLQNGSSELKIFTKGGNGGNTSANNGEGGGGGGGLIITNALAFPSKIDTSTSGGLRGTRGIGQRYSENGKYGRVKTNFIPLLNGFLFNTIRSSVSRNKVDSVCSNSKPPMITGTQPVGGSGTYTFEWQKSYESTFASPVVLTNDADPTNYTPTLADAITPTDTVWFRRIVRDAGPPAITDISKAVKIVVHRAISNNKVGKADTICYNGNPPLLQQLLPDLVVPTTKYLFYNWQDSSSTGTWGSTISTDKEFDPPALVNSTRYRRTVTSGSCVNTSPSVEITVLPVITGNSIISPPEDICFGMKFQELRASKKSGTVPLLGGGDGSYRFKWESNINYTGGWITAQGISNRDSLNPVERPVERIPQNDYEYRRIVFSGNDNVCSDTSDIVHLRDFPVITNNNIFMVVANQPICSGSAPPKITGNTPNNGNNLFTWQDSTNSSTQWKDISGYVYSVNNEYQPPVLTATTKYRRLAFSIACSDTSNSIEIVVLPGINNNNISLASLALDTTICNGKTPHMLIGTSASGGDGTYAYQWQNSSTIAGPFADIVGATQVNYTNPPSLNVTTFYKRQVTSDACISQSSATITINVLSPISNNVIATYPQAVCENTIPDPVTGSIVAGGSGTYLYLWEQSTDGGTNWIAADGINTLPNYQPPLLSNPISYRRNVSSADCLPTVTPAVDININPEPQGPVYAGADESIFSIDGDYSMNADPPVVSGETGFWTVLEPGSAVIVNQSDSKSEVRKLSTGNNLFVWSITNDLCNISDSVNIEMLPYSIPQGFSPNGDAWNNKFIIEGLNLSDQQIAELRILNGAGTVVFTTTNKDGQEWVDWDGRNSKGNELPEGTYYYLLYITTNEKLVSRKSGFVELKRY